MSFTVDDFHDLVRLVEERPEWRAELRRLVLTDELLALPEQLAELRAQSERQFQALAAAQERTDKRLAELTTAEQQTASQVASLTRTVSTLVDDVGDLKGQNLEMLYRQRAAAYLGRIARRIKTLSTDAVAILLDDAVEQGQLADAERDDILLAELIVRGRSRDNGTQVYLVVEISVGIGPHDIERAVHRATLLSKLGTPAIAVVAGKTMTDAATRLAQTQPVWQVTNGHAVPPTSKLRRFPG